MARSVDPELATARREAITSAAADLFARRGFEKTTAAEIARAAGMSSGSVFYYFKDKRAVFRSVFERDVPESRELVERCLAETDPLAAILTMVDAIAAEALHPHAWKILVELLRQVDQDPELAQVVSENASILYCGFEELIERGIRSGSFDTELDPRDAAAWIQKILDGAFLTADPVTDPRPMLRRIVTRFLVPPTHQGGTQ
ncbi:TetR family transcriptional regulator [Allosaccharopolyspora coralli]|uniref:TetR family transcriptional regulator n=1 Tax=Allosaccharopolyspora coralli TaxID=2665642 RepID=A0A5Q3QJN0_9PSEU|nr:TetR/AcrR family transcriptional regulator [Allosaccharopolyspora coralli]QGK71735.1 TetR family transcriptional regulator [Allosaccharopolyspora coralli]